MTTFKLVRCIALVAFLCLSTLVAQAEAKTIDVYITNNSQAGIDVQLYFAQSPMHNTAQIAPQTSMHLVLDIPESDDLIGESVSNGPFVPVGSTVYYLPPNEPGVNGIERISSTVYEITFD